MSSAVEPGCRGRTLFALLVLAMACSDARPVDEEITQEEVLAAEEEKREGYVRLDTAVVGRFLADDYQALSSDRGRIGNRQDGIQAIADHAEEADVRPIDSIDYDGTTVRIHGNVAVVTGTETIVMTFPTQSPPDTVRVRLLFTNVWVKREGRLQLILQQRTPVA